MAVQSYNINGAGQKEPAPPPAPKRPRFDPSLFLIRLGGWLAVAAFGGLFWLVNGGFSVRGLEAISALFGTGGALFWGLIAGIPLPLPAGLPPQPLVPWVGVVAATLIQVGITWRLIAGKSVPPWVIAVGLLLSIYDLATTFFGFGALEWVQRGGLVAQIPLSLLFTFGLELLIGFLLRNRR